MTDGMDFQAFNQQLIAAFRECGGIGTLGPVDFEHLVLLTTEGRSSGKPGTVPLGYVRDDDGSLLLFASNMAAPISPQWYRNIEAMQDVTVEITGATWPTGAIMLFGPERDEAYRRWVEANPHVADHEQKSRRLIPMVRIPLP